MIEGFAIRIRYDETGVAVGLRPVERERDLVRGRFHYSPDVWFVVGWAGGVAGAGGGGGGIAGGLSELERIRTAVPAISTIQPRLARPAASCAMVPLNPTRM